MGGLGGVGCRARNQARQVPASVISFDSFAFWPTIEPHEFAVGSRSVPLSLVALGTSGIGVKLYLRQ